MSDSKIIELATPSDASSIVEILNQNLISNQNANNNLEQNGFLISPASREEIQALISDKENSIVLVAKEHQKIIGYITSITLDKKNEDYQKKFQEVLSKNNYDFSSEKILYYKQIAKKPGVSGVGNLLLRSLIEKATEANYKHIICEIVQKPFQNKISTGFHEKFGFEQIGLGQRNDITLGVFIKSLTLPF